MKLSVHYVLPTALAVALVITLGATSVTPEETVPGTEPISEPLPTTLRSCAKDVLARAINDDGMSLTDAASLLGEVYRLLPDPPGLDFTLDDPHSDGSPPTVEERLCRRVIDWVKSGRVDAEAVARLDAEFRGWRQERTGRLPDPTGLAQSSAELLQQARTEWLAQCGGKRRGRMPAARDASD